ncbi:glia-derived nexin isoform X1 [Columba livia]
MKLRQLWSLGSCNLDMACKSLSSSFADGASPQIHTNPRYLQPEIMNWHFSLLFVLGTLTSVCSQFSFYPLEELSSDVGIQVFNQIVKAKPQDNVVVSPHGIASVLGVLQLGADGKTKKQLTTMMRYSVNGVGKALKKINRLIVSKKNKDIVTIANAVFAKNGFKMEVPFVTRNKEVFQCSVKSVDFEDPNAACDSINQWVKNETRGMIDQVVAPDDIDGSLTRLVLVNAVYFKGLWKSRFRPENTKKRPFYGADGKIYQVPMLSQLSIFRCGTTSTPNELWYNIIELPYHGEMISMLIALPTENKTPLSAIIPHISTKTIGSWMTTMVAKRVQVILPKFTAVAETDLKDPLKALGITDMFDQSKANFAKITRTEGLHVSHVLQKTKIEVSEDGTKASAATTAILIARSSPPWFIVDRPFVFFIRHNPTGTILFMGQINKP